MARTVLATVMVVLSVRTGAAQDPAPRIGPFVLDLHGTVPRFKSDDDQLARSRGLDVSELPGSGLGVHAAAHVYPLRWKAVTFGLGVDAAIAKSRHAARQQSDGTTVGRATTERFANFAPQLSFNFGDGDGWSYLSGGIGASQWSIVRDGSDPLPPDTERLKTINYGGGARWFIKRHLAFSFDVRFYAIDPATPFADLPNGPRTTLLVMGAGVSLK